MDLMNFIMEKALILIPVLYILGMFLKNTFIIPDWTIPWILLFFGIAGSISLLGISADSVIQGVLIAGVTVFSNQLIKQTKDRD